MCDTQLPNPRPARLLYQKSLTNPESIVLRDHQHDHDVLLASKGIRTVKEMTAAIQHLRQQRLSLLLADLVARIRCEKPLSVGTAPLYDLLRHTDNLSEAVLTDDAHENHDLRAEIRSMLWELRTVLDPLNPSEALRTSLEVARSSFLDIPGRVNANSEGPSAPRDEALVRSEMYALMVTNVLLEELRSLRVLERQLNDVVVRLYPNRVEPQLSVASDASALLGIDDYRVRGKMRLADAVLDLRKALRREVGRPLLPEINDAINVLHNALIKSLHTDLSVRQPAGEAMLLRPRMDDIPNFAVVSQSILRGGQPSSRGLKWLANYGVKLVVDLRGSDRENQWEMPKCRLLTEPSTKSNGCAHQNVDGGSAMRFCNIAVEDFNTPTMEQVYEFIELTKFVDRQNGVLFVHCKAGIGRTGTLIACWRIFQGEPIDIALAKERLYCEGGGGLRQENFVRDFAVLHASRNSTP